MRLASIGVPLLKEAIATYLEEAWGDLAPSHWPKIDLETDDLETALSGFSNERSKGRMRKYALRLGNRRYPFMKLVFQESLIRDAFFFAVDTHDELDIKATTPDYAEWLAIREYNAKVKNAVEARWRAVAIPTFVDILADIESQPVPPSEICPLERPPLIHVTDDDVDIANGVCLILQRRRYSVEVTHSAEEELELLKTSRPDLILSDLEMGSGLTGIQLCEKVRQVRGLEDTPFILATAAGNVDLTQLGLIDGFIVKPYEIEVLMTFIEQHLVSSESDR